MALIFFVSVVKKVCKLVRIFPLTIAVAYLDTLSRLFYIFFVEKSLHIVWKRTTL